MQAGDKGKSGSTGGQDGQGGRGGSGGSDGQGGPQGFGGCGGPRGSVNEGAGGAAAGSAPPVAGAPAPGGEPSPTARGSRSQLREFILRVPFPSRMEAEIAHRSLTQFEVPHLLGIQREFAITGNILVVWISENPGQLQNAFVSFLEQLFLVVQTMQCFGPLFPTKFLPGKGI